MKILRQILFTLVAVGGLAFAAHAQKDDKNRPPKEKPPVVVPGDKKNPPPPRDDKPKKPGASWFGEFREEN